MKTDMTANIKLNKPNFKLSMIKVNSHTINLIVLKSSMTMNAHKDLPIAHKLRIFNKSTFLIRS